MAWVQSTWESPCKNLKTVFCPLTWESPCKKPSILKFLDPIDMGIPMSKTTRLTAFGSNRHGNPHVKNLPPYSFWVQSTWESPCKKPSPLQLLTPIDMGIPMSKTFSTYHWKQQSSKEAKKQRSKAAKKQRSKEAKKQRKDIMISGFFLWGDKNPYFTIFVFSPLDTHFRQT